MTMKFLFTLYGCQPEVLKGDMLGLVASVIGVNTYKPNIQCVK